LNNNFWNTYRTGSPSIEELLNKENCTVEMLLEDDDILQEFKSQNQKLLTYFTHEKLKQLIDLITEMPAEDADNNRGHKFPFLASEIFNCELNTVLEKFFEAPIKPETDKADETTTSASIDKTDDDTEDSVKMVESLDPDKDIADFLEDVKKDDAEDEPQDK